MLRRILHRSLFSVALLALLLSSSLCAEGPEYTIVVDAGHGGAVINRKDDKWDPVHQKYQDYYNSGMEYKDLKEYEVVLELSLKVRKYLELTQSARGWSKFEKILKKFSPNEHFPRVRFNVAMTREESWEKTGLKKEDPRVNAPFRLYDYPDDPENPQKILPGRLSFINSQKPHLVLSLHLNPAIGNHPGGMAAVLSPGFRTFDTIRKIHLNKLPSKRFFQLKWVQEATWLTMEPGWSSYESARADTWVYFHGYRSNKSGTDLWWDKNRGFRWNMVTWHFQDPPGWEVLARKHEPGPYSLNYRRYRPEGKFWDRERGQPELWRREDGPLGYGGDNHYASDEILRFIQFGVRQMSSRMSKPGAIGEIQPPYVSTYSLPTFTNAIVAYLEVGYLNRKRDRKVVIDHMDETARSIAAGIYSLFMGLKLKKEAYPFQPQGNPIDFKKYETLPEGNYFKIVTD